jgi:hypothetical protein
VFTVRGRGYAYTCAEIYACCIVELLLSHAVLVSGLWVVLVVLVPVFDKLNLFLRIWWIWRVDVFVKRLLILVA